MNIKKKFFVGIIVARGPLFGSSERGRLTAVLSAPLWRGAAGGVCGESGGDTTWHGGIVCGVAWGQRMWQGTDSGTLALCPLAGESCAWPYGHGWPIVGHCGTTLDCALGAGGRVLRPVWARRARPAPPPPPPPLSAPCVGAVALCSAASNYPYGRKINVESCVAVCHTLCAATGPRGQNPFTN
jgi:hypothetical protein